MRSRVPEGIKSNYNTIVGEVGGDKAVMYRNVLIVRVTAKAAILNRGGLDTKTTRLKMNQAAYSFHLPYNVYLRHGVWFVLFTNTGERKPFTDGMAVDL